MFCSGRFEDASDVLVDRTCPICSMKFNTSEPAELFYSHVEDHVVKVCPVCTQEFQPDDNAFELHVNLCVNISEQQQQQQERGMQLPPDMELV